MPLPLRSQDVKLPSNKSLALRRLLTLKARFKRDPSFHKDYTDFMEETIKNCAEERLTTFHTMGSSIPKNFTDKSGL